MNELMLLSGEWASYLNKSDEFRVRHGDTCL
jgi:hypothetical protein